MQKHYKENTSIKSKHVQAFHPLLEGRSHNVSQISFIIN